MIDETERELAKLAIKRWERDKCEHCGAAEKIEDSSEYENLAPFITINNYCEDCLQELSEAIDDVCSSFIENND